MVDYLAALELLVMPFVLNLGASAPLAKWLAIATGLAVILVSLLTDYKLGLVRIIPFRIHLGIDTAVAKSMIDAIKRGRSLPTEFVARLPIIE